MSDKDLLVNSTDAYERIKKLRGKKPRPANGQAFDFSPADSKKLYDELRRNDLRIAHSWEIGAHEVKRG